ncbi:MAG: hypothetical protein CVU60_08435 [Deltaproteobacteria bacterium HGW-Deltaproteobacteria-18]|nr:MAG: hypothetical protein CVU60_08435 [Deltaproteobacteria bacterium HGW-Deltaproteobacteria-18]
MKSEKWDADLNAFASHSLVSSGESVHSAGQMANEAESRFRISIFRNIMNILPLEFRRVI